MEFKVLDTSIWMKTMYGLVEDCSWLKIRLICFFSFNHVEWYLAGKAWSLLLDLTNKNKLRWFFEDVFSINPRTAVYFLLGAEGGHLIYYCSSKFMLKVCANDIL